ncbi:MAG: phosphatase PAP2 family protein [Ignavibacterium sp.]|nr:MAG: phosphatase PAP2 family protein [Ignavibacterium sp.]
MILHRTVLLLLALVFHLNPINHAQNEHYSPFKLDVTREALIYGAGIVSGITALALLSKLPPLTVDEVNALNPADVNSFDRSAIGPKREENAGDFLLFTSYLLPLTFLAYEETRNDFPELLLIYGEVLIITGSLNGIVKGIVKRTRPYTYSDETPIEKRTTAEARVSFYSGHTAVTAAITFYMANVFTTYISNKTTQILIWSAAALYPAITAYLRVDSANHFPTDVIVGYLVGAGIGFLVPELHKVQKENNFSLGAMMTDRGSGLSLKWNF